MLCFCMILGLITYELKEASGGSKEGLEHQGIAHYPEYKRTNGQVS